MNKKKIIWIMGLLTALAAAGAFITYKVFKASRCSEQQNVIVIWNNSSKHISVELRFSHLKPKYVEIARGVRACISLLASKKFKSWDDLRYLEIGYGKKKYRFTKEGCLNISEKCEGGRSARYFMVADLMMNDAAWEQVKQRYQEKDKELDEDYRYLVLSNYGKKESPWGPKAHIQMLKSKLLRP